MASVVVPVELEHLNPPDQGIELQLAAADFGPVSVQSLSFSATACERTLRLARDASTPSVFLAVNRAGLTTVVQEGRECTVGAGQVVMWSSMRPSFVVATEPGRHHLVRIPVSLLAVPDTALRCAVATSLGRETAVAGVLSRFVADLARLPHLPLAEAERLAPPLTELVRALILTVADDRRRTRESSNLTLHRQVNDSETGGQEIARTVPVREQDDR